MASDEQNPEVQGRELLIHEKALARLARVSVGRAKQITDIVIRTRVIKAGRHALVEDAVWPVALMRLEEAGIVFASFESRMCQGQASNEDRFTTLFKQIGWAQPEATSDKSGPILAPEESVYATCGYGRWFDAATTAQTAAHMYDDERNPDDLIRAREQGTPIEGYLTLIGENSILTDTADKASEKGTVSDQMFSAINIEAATSLGNEAIKILGQAMGYAAESEDKQEDPVYCLAVNAIGRIVSQNIRNPYYK